MNSHDQNYHPSHLALRTYPDISHQLTDQQLASKPQQLARILYFALPFIFLAISSIFLLARNLRIHQNNLVKVFPKRWYIYIILFISLVGLATIGIQAVLQNAWTVRQWIMFTTLCILFTIAQYIYTVDTNSTIVLSTLAILLTAIGNQWFFVQLRNLSENTQGQIGWKHVDRNIIGFIEAALIILFYIHFCQSLQYAFKCYAKLTAIIFWILAPLTIVGILVLNIVNYGPFLDSIGYIVAAIILFIGALDSTFFYSDQEYERKELN